MDISRLRFHAVSASHVLRVLALVLAGWSLVPHSAWSQSRPSNSRFALLIGVGAYPSSGITKLDGSANDVAAMRELLTGRFGFPNEQVISLVDEQATGFAIREAMGALAEQITGLSDDGPPAQVVVHFSGHGSQVPDQASGADRDEEDGFDETWVPYDAKREAGEADIRDDELNKLVHRICDGGKARLLMIWDCCHSGSGARGTTKTRQLNRELKATRSDAPINPKRLPEDAVFLSACRAKEKEPEFQDGAKTYGLLTRYLVQALSQERSVSGLSYDLLQKAIVANYGRDGVMQSVTPQLEGRPATLQKTVLGFGEDVDRIYYEVEKSASSGQVLVRAGKFHNVTMGSLFELYERPEQIATAIDGDGSNSSSLAWLRITAVEGTTSTAQVIRWEDDERTKQIYDRLPSAFKKGFAVLRHHQSTEMRLRLKVVSVNGEDSDSAPLGPNDPVVKTIAETLTGIHKEGETQWLQWITAHDQACDLVLRIDGNYAALFPATGVAEVVGEGAETQGGEVPTSLRGGWGPIDMRTGKDSSERPQSLADYLRKITRARNLISLSQSRDGNGASDYNVELELMNVVVDESRQIISSEVCNPDHEGTRIVTEEQAYALRVTNQGEKAVYVTVLTISADMGIEVVMPFEEPLVKLESGETRASHAFRCTPPLGSRDAILLVTHEPADFSFVAQAELPKTRSAFAGGGAGALADRLAELAFFQPRKTRGGRPKRSSSKKADTSWRAKILSWRAIP